MKVTPPNPNRPKHESAGFLGYYANIHLGGVFDIIDADGCWPAVWVYRKNDTHTFRFFEEKPRSDAQSLHASQHRVFRDLASMDRISCYVIWEADRLVEGAAGFPLQLTRLAPMPRDDTARSFNQSDFDRWLLDGYEPIQRLASMPYEPPPEWPSTRDEWGRLDTAVTKLAMLFA